MAISGSGSSRKRDLNIEVSVINFIDIMAVCIFVLLMTAQWLHIGTMNVKQAIGGQPVKATAKQPTLWAYIQTDGAIHLQLQDAPIRIGKIQIKGTDGRPDLVKLDRELETLKARVPALNVALVQPKANTVYEDVISLMDHFKRLGFNDLGVAPL
jgi:biopolymer transport protein ExbD